MENRKKRLKKRFFLNIEQNKTKIGIYCGSFNPITLAHYQVPKNLLDNQIVDKIIYMPVSNGSRKKGLIDSKHRLEMIKLQIEHTKKMEVSDLEIQYFNKHKVQLNILITLKYLNNIYKNNSLSLIIGADNFYDFSNWYKPEEFLINNSLIVIKRDKYDVEEIFNSNTLFQKYKDKIKFVDSSYLKCSSTKVRSDIANNTKSTLISDKVYNYINKNNLYK